MTLFRKLRDLLRRKPRPVDKRTPLNAKYLAVHIAEASSWKSK
jgi:hypothetical protein